ncbi:hypothetical protein [Clostridium sp. KNHs205]|jgi:hypothetical protein|uniref:hypothetical protein n=1 Tax=Clostridium sp. KNHs205 TaxID=1449050 RepID=UPI00051C2539|nr:hypothetical protein [Clostridium sp. KNHs205]
MKRQEQLIIPQELKTIEVDVEKKIFKINGKEFGKDCTGFRITCIPGSWSIQADVDTTVHFVEYDSKGEKKSDQSYKRNGQDDY